MKASRPRLLDLFCGAGGAAIMARFWKYVDRSGGPDACWLWTGSLRKNGYGQLNIKRYPFKTHQVSFFINKGYLPPEVLHSCDNPACVNPAHLFGGTQKDNLTDAAKKGRTAGLPKGIVHHIRSLAKEGASFRWIGKYLGLHHTTVSRIVRGLYRANV
jgi:hypothetical protein